MKDFHKLPALISLVAGFIISIVLIYQQYALVEFLWILVMVMVSFYIAGLILRFILNKTFGELGDQENTNVTKEKNTKKNTQDTQQAPETSVQQPSKKIKK